VRRSGVLRIGIVLLVASVAAGLFALVGRADNPNFDQISSSLKPGFIDPTGDVLYYTQWHDNDNRTFTHTRIEITIPAGWTLVSSSPSGCTLTGTTVTCPRGALHFGDLVAQSVRLHSDADLGPQTVDSSLLVYERPENPGRGQRIPTDSPKQVDVLDPATTPDKTGSCVGGHFSIGTLAGSGESDTTATAPATNQLCTPITIDEHARQNPTEFCLPNRQCVTDIVMTDAALVPTTTPIQLKIVFRGSGLNNNSLIFTSSIGQLEVPACTAPGAASPDPCYYDRRARQQSLTWFVNWSGLDPGWTG
jgi:hypothetical protein